MSLERSLNPSRGLSWIVGCNSIPLPHSFLPFQNFITCFYSVFLRFFDRFGKTMTCTHIYTFGALELHALSGSSASQGSLANSGSLLVFSTCRKVNFTFFFTYKYRNCSDSLCKFLYLLTLVLENWVRVHSGSLKPFLALDGAAQRAIPCTASFRPVFVPEPPAHVSVLPVHLQIRL